MLKTQVLSRTEAEIQARVEVTDALKQPLGLVHGGVFATLADQLPITGGHVNATARRRHHGRTTAVWEVDMTDDEGRLCALVRITLACRQGIPPRRQEPGAGVSAAGTRS
jgi:1,4-dihydroxy-2-naphthoyl-CoA hydrolase